MQPLDYDDLDPLIRQRIEDLAARMGWTIEQAIEEIVLEGVAMGGLTLAFRKKAELVPIGTKESLKRD